MNILQIVNRIENLHDDDVMFIESKGVKYEEDLAFPIF